MEEIFIPFPGRRSSIRADPEALRERITDNPAEFSTEMMRAKERLDAHLAEIQAFVEQHPELTCGIPMFEAVQCRHLAELAGVGAICGEQRLDGTRLQESQGSSCAMIRKKKSGHIAGGRKF